MSSHREFPTHQFLTVDSHYGGHDHPGELLGTRPWERQPGDTHKSFAAFTIYCQMGSDRSLAKVSRRLGKSTPLMERWSKRDNWVIRAGAWDAYQSLAINERILRGSAEMRERQIRQALELQTKAYQRALKMTPEEIRQLTPAEMCLLFKTGTDIENRARDFLLERIGFSTNLQLPKFEIRIIQPGADMVPVRLPDGRAGYVPQRRLEDFRRDFPTAIVVE